MTQIIHSCLKKHGLLLFIMSIKKDSLDKSTMTT